MTGRVFHLRNAPGPLAYETKPSRKALEVSTIRAAEH